MYKKEKSESFRNIFREVYGQDYPEEVDPDGFVTITDLEKIASNLNVGLGDKFIDLGCGRGGPGLWIARKTQSDYIGIDLSENAIRMANKRIKDFHLSSNVQFMSADICALDFPDNCFDGAISLDVLGFVPDLTKALLEIARILRSNSNFVFTAWEVTKPDNIKDYKQLLLNSGFDLKIYEEITDWKSRQQKVYEETLKNKKSLIKDMGRDGAFIWIMDAKVNLPALNYMKRRFVVGTKQ